MPTEVDAYLAALPADQRAALQKLREAIQAAAPEATESISYGVPTFKLDGRPLVAYGAAKGHCSFYLMSTAAMAELADELAGRKVGKGSIQFQPKDGLPAALVRRVVRFRQGELAAASGKRR